MLRNPTIIDKMRPFSGNQFLVLLLLAAPALALAAGVKDFGAKGDGISDDTAAVQAAIDACAKQGEPLVFPAGTFLTGTIRLHSHTEIELSAKAVWKGIPMVDAYPLQQVSLAGGAKTVSRRALIFAQDAERIVIRGHGTIDGNGSHEAFRDGIANSPARPYGLWIVRGRDIRIEGIHLRNSAFWMQHYAECDHLRISGIRVFNHANLNNDGLDIDDCHDVVVSDSVFDSTDDALCMKSEGGRGVSDVVITNCLLASHADAIKLGTASHGGFRRIAINNIVIRPSAADRVGHPLQVKGGLAGIDLMSTDGGTLEDIVIQNVVMDGVETPLVIKLGNRWTTSDKTMPGAGAARAFVTEENPADAPRATDGSVRNVRIAHVVARRSGPIPSSITGYPGHPVENITLNDVLIEVEGGSPACDQPVLENSSSYPYNRMFGRELPAYAFFIRHAANVCLRDVQVKTIAPDGRRAVAIEDATVTLDNVEIVNSGGLARGPVLVDRPGAVRLLGVSTGLKVDTVSP